MTGSEVTSRLARCRGGRGLRPDLSDVQSVCECLQRLAGVGQPEVQRRLLQHLLVAVGVVLAVGGERAAVVPVLLHGHLGVRAEGQTDDAGEK